ncbi:MAG: aminoacyl--tRNA ligase-related protein [Candidatus Hydrothermarchaeales archaeon]
MRFEMLADLVCSDDIKDPKVVDEAFEGTEELLQKGVPKGEEGAKIASYSVLGNKITVELISGRYARCHDAILRINKHLSSILGRGLKIGIRTIEVKSYEIWYDLEEEPLEGLSLPFVEKLDIEGKKAHLVLKDINQEALERNYVDRLLKRLDEKVKQQHVSGKVGFVNTVETSKPRLKKYKMKEDPTEVLIKRNWVRRAGSGVWTVLPPYAALWRAIESLVFDVIAKPLGFQELLLPKIISLDIQKRKGQLGGIPNEIWWVCPPKTRDPKEWEEYTDYVKITGEKNPNMLMANLGNPEFSLAYAQCEPFYDLWRGKVIDREKLPLKFIDNYGPTWRYESGGLKGLERLNEFKRMELAWIGSPEDAIKIRDKVRDLSVKIIDEIFDLEWKVDATTAIYMEHGGGIMEGEDREYIRTYDLTILLPFETMSRPEKELEIASFHVHEDFYAKNFSWKERKNRTLWSGCTGISPTRWAYVFLLRHGFDYDSWPKEIKRYIGDELPTLPDGLFV